MKKEIENILSMFDTATMGGLEIIKKIVKEKGGLLDTQNLDGKYDEMNGIFFDNEFMIQREVKVKAIRLNNAGGVMVFVGFTDITDVQYTKEELENSVENTMWEDTGFWTPLYGGEVWTLPTMQSILEGLEGYVEN